MSAQQSKAIRLADLIDANLAGAGDAEISAELRRLYEENVQIREQRDELLNAVLFMLSNHCNHISRSDVNAVRAAIAKAGGAA